MSQEQLQRLIEKVGESQKKGVSWLNGRFGFGVHSFRYSILLPPIPPRTFLNISSRAAAEKLTVKTKRADGPMLKMEITRDQMDGIAPPQEVSHTPNMVSDGVYNCIIP